jgi:hypothetical protein
MMVAGMAAGYMGSIDGWVLQQFDRLLARYDGGDRVMLRSVVQFDVDNLIERALITAGDGDENSLLNKIQLLRFGSTPSSATRPTAISRHVPGALAFTRQRTKRRRKTSATSFSPCRA